MNRVASAEEFAEAVVVLLADGAVPPFPGDWTTALHQTEEAINASRVHAECDAAAYKALRSERDKLLKAAKTAKLRNTLQRTQEQVRKIKKQLAALR